MVRSLSGEILASSKNMNKQTRAAEDEVGLLLLWEWWYATLSLGTNLK